MIDQDKIEEVRKKIKKTIEEQPMVIDNEPDCSGTPENTIEKDEEERSDEKRDRN